MPNTICGSLRCVTAVILISYSLFIPPRLYASDDKDVALFCAFHKQYGNFFYRPDAAPRDPEWEEWATQCLKIDQIPSKESATKRLELLGYKDPTDGDIENYIRNYNYEKTSRISDNRKKLESIARRELAALGLHAEERMDMFIEEVQATPLEWFQKTSRGRQFSSLARRVLEKAKKNKPSATSAPQLVSDVDKPPSFKAKPKPYGYAVVVGIESYREQLPKADFADRDAKLVGDYLAKALGYPEKNIALLVNEKAARTDLEKYFEAWLPNNVEKDSSVFIYYSGHGTPHTKSGDAYLVPYDGDLTFIEKTGYPLKRLYAALDKLPAKDVTVVLDSCFSGAGGRSVLASGVKPMVLSVENMLAAGGKTVVLAASSGDQISSAYSEKGHGLLTYFFLKGLQGEGDLNKDGAIDLAELYQYVKPNVQRIARKQFNNDQIPQLLANPDLLRKGASRLVERMP